MIDPNSSESQPFNYCGEASDPMEQSVRNVVCSLLGANPEIWVVSPGAIRPAPVSKSEVQIRITVSVDHGWKAIARSASTQQELFIATSLSKEELTIAIRKAISRTRVKSIVRFVTKLPASMETV
jgi:hypothetical protein